MLRGNKVSLRPFREDDIPYLIKWTLDPELHHLVEGDYPRTAEAALTWAASAGRDRHKRYYVIVDEGGRPIGDIELDHIAWRSGDAELRIRIGEKSCWNKGYGSDCINIILRHAFFDLNLRRVYLRVFADNGRAIGCYLKCGFRPEGTLVRGGGRYGGSPRRIVLMRILRTEFLASLASAPSRGAGEVRRGADSSRRVS